MSKVYRAIDGALAVQLMGWQPVADESDNVVISLREPNGKEHFFTDPQEDDNEWSPSTSLVDVNRVVSFLKDKKTYLNIDTFENHITVYKLNELNECVILADIIGQTDLTKLPYDISLAIAEAFNININRIDKEGIYY